MQSGKNRHYIYHKHQKAQMNTFEAHWGEGRIFLWMRSLCLQLLSAWHLSNGLHSHSIPDKRKINLFWAHGWGTEAQSSWNSFQRESLRNQTGTQDFECHPPLLASVLPAPGAGLASAQRQLHQRTHTWSTEWWREERTPSHTWLASVILLWFCFLSQEFFKRGIEREQKKHVQRNLFTDNGSRTGWL